MDFTLELIVVPVSDVDRAKAFYTERMGFGLDVDHSQGENFRVVQASPSGSSCSIAFGVGLGDMPPGSLRGVHLMVTDIEAARAELIGRGVEVGEARHMTSHGWEPGADPEHADYASFAELADPDGNVWLLQERGHR